MAQVYLSIGSNLGNRMQMLQNGIDTIASSIGSVDLISTVVETPAVGFNGQPFLNACCAVQTTLAPQQLMDGLLSIEEKYGRKRANNGYEDRTLDLDLLFYDDIVVRTQQLSIPHPSLHKRNFVLGPLVEIAPNKVHPLLQKTAQELLRTCVDTTELSPVPALLLHPMYSLLQQHSFISVEGIIGCGKTSLAKALASALGYKSLEERFADNPFLPKFYRNPKRYAFPLELSFLADRFKQINEDAEQLDLFQSGVVADYHISKSLVFAKNTLQEDEFPLFQQLYELMSRSANQPTLCIYLQQTPQRAQKNIKKRGRSYEQNIRLDYLTDLSKGYQEHIPFLASNMKLVVVDVSDLDFVLYPEDMKKLINRINAQLGEAP